MVVLALRSRRMVPGPESNSNLVSPTASITEHELRSREGTQVPDPRMVKFIAGFSTDMRAIFFLSRGLKGVVGDSPKTKNI